MISREEARATLPKDFEVSDSELEEVLAFFYFLGEQAYERVREEAKHGQ